MRKVLVFCSNPVNGGTAEMFVQCCIALQKADDFKAEIIPCVNQGNPVRIFSMLPSLVRLNILSETQVCGAYQAGRSLMQRIKNRCNRNWRYKAVKKENIKIISEFLKTQAIDTVLIHNGGYVGDDLCNQMLEAAYLARVQKRIMVFHGAFTKTLLDRVRFWTYDRMLNRCATAVVTGSHYSNEQLRGNTSLQNLHVIPNGISYEDTVSDEEKKAKVEYHQADVQFVQVGNFYESKGQLSLLQAFAKLNECTDKEVRLTLIGNVYDESFYGRCKAFIKKHKLNKKVTIVHNIFNSREYMNIFDVMVVSSLGGEDLPMVPLEAMRSSVPVIAYACNGVPEEVRDGHNGLLVDVGDVRALSLAMQKMVDDVGLRIRLGQQGKQDYEAMFTGEAMGNRYITLLQECE